MQRYDPVAPNLEMNKRITISMPPELEARLAAAKPKYQSLSGFYCELLDGGITLGKPSREGSRAGGRRFYLLRLLNK